MWIPFWESHVGSAVIATESGSAASQLEATQIRTASVEVMNPESGSIGTGFLPWSNHPCKRRSEKAEGLDAIDSQKR